MLAYYSMLTCTVQSEIHHLYYAIF